MYMLVVHKETFINRNVYQAWPEVYNDWGIEGCEELCRNGADEWLKRASAEEKIALLEKAIDSVIDLESFRECMNAVAEKQTELGKERSLKVESLKKLEDDLSKARAEMDDTKDRVDELEKEEKKDSTPYSRTKVLQSKKKLETLESKVERLQANIASTDAEVDNYMRRIKFLPHPVKLLGRDRQKRKYYFFSDEPTAIYVEPFNVESEMEEASSKDKESKQPWSIISTRKNLDALISSMSRYGLRESRLIEALEELVKGRYLNLPEEKNTTSLSLRLDSAESGLSSYSSMYRPQVNERGPKTRAKKAKTEGRVLSPIQNYFNQVMGAPSKPLGLSWLYGVVIALDVEVTRYLHSLGNEWALKEIRDKYRKSLADDAEGVEPLTESRLRDYLLAIDNGLRMGIRYIRLNPPPSSNKGSKKGASASSKNSKKRGVFHDEDSEEENSAKEDGSSEKNQPSEGEEADDDEIGDEDEDYEVDRVFDPTKFKTGKVCNFPFGYYREKVRSSWRALLETRNSLVSLYIAVAVYANTLSYYINRKVEQIKERREGEYSTYGHDMIERYKRLCAAPPSLKEEEKKLSRSERAMNRTRGSERIQL